MNELQAVLDVRMALSEGLKAINDGVERDAQVLAIEGVAKANAYVLYIKATNEDNWIPREVWLHALDGLSAMWWSVMCEIVGDPIEGIDQETHDKFVEGINHLRHQWRYSL